MATNYNSLIHSENKLKEDFYKYLKLTYEIHKKTWLYINSNKMNDDAMDDLLHDEEASDNYEWDILDECVWIISKDQPRSNHLRFIISIIYSIKDLERIADYAIDIAKLFFNGDISKDETKILKKIFADYLNSFKLYVDLITKKNDNEFFVKGRKIRDDFGKLYSDEFEAIIMNKLINKSGMHNVMLVMKSIDRTMHHIYNIFTNFRFIKNEKKLTRRIE